MENNNNDGLLGLAIASIICGVGSWFAFAIVLAPLGVVLGLLSLGSKNSTAKNCAIVGLMVSIVSLALFLFTMAMIAGMR